MYPTNLGQKGWNREPMVDSWESGIGVDWDIEDDVPEDYIFIFFFLLLQYLGDTKNILYDSKYYVQYTT